MLNFSFLLYKIVLFIFKTSFFSYSIYNNPVSQLHKSIYIHRYIYIYICMYIFKIYLPWQCCKPLQYYFLYWHKSAVRTVIEWSRMSRIATKLEIKSIKRCNFSKKRLNMIAALAFSFQHTILAASYNIQWWAFLIFNFHF